MKLGRIESRVNTSWVAAECKLYNALLIMWPAISLMMVEKLWWIRHEWWLIGLGNNRYQYLSGIENKDVRTPNNAVECPISLATATSKWGYFFAQSTLKPSSLDTARRTWYPWERSMLTICYGSYIICSKDMGLIWITRNVALDLLLAPVTWTRDSWVYTDYAYDLIALSTSINSYASISRVIEEVAVGDVRLGIIPPGSVYS